MTAIEHLKAKPIAGSVVVWDYSPRCAVADHSYSHLLGWGYFIRPWDYRVSFRRRWRPAPFPSLRSIISIIVRW